MERETLAKLRESEHFTLLLDESTDNANRSELSLIARIVENGCIENHFLTLLQLPRCDAETIFNKVYDYLQENEIEYGWVCHYGWWVQWRSGSFR